MDYDTDDIDFGRAAMLLSVVKDCAGVGPQLMSLSSAAMHELVDMNKDLSERQTNAGKKRIAEEQAKAAFISQEAQRAQDELADQTRTKRTSVKPINVKPGEPDELVETEKRLAAQDTDQGEDILGERRV